MHAQRQCLFVAFLTVFRLTSIAGKRSSRRKVFYEKMNTSLDEVGTGPPKRYSGHVDTREDEEAEKEQRIADAESSHYHLPSPDINFMIHQPIPEFASGQLLSDKGRSAVLYFFVHHGELTVLKVPRNKGVEEHLIAEVTMISFFNPTRGIQVPHTELVKISFDDLHGHRITAHALLKTFLYGYDLSDVIMALGHGESSFDTNCLVFGRNVTDASVSALRPRVLKMEGPAPISILSWTDRRKHSLGKAIQSGLKCFFARLATDLLMGVNRKPLGIFSDLSAANFMWATPERTDDPERYDLWLVDAAFFARGTDDYNALLSAQNHDFEALWKNTYKAQWDYGGPGLCKSSAWPQLLLPGTLGETLEWSSYCKHKNAHIMGMI